MRFGILNFFDFRKVKLCIYRVFYNILTGWFGASLVRRRLQWDTGMRRIPTFRSTTDRMYDGGTIILQYNIIILTIVLQLPTVFSRVTCCTGL